MSTRPKICTTIRYVTYDDQERFSIHTNTDFRYWTLCSIRNFKPRAILWRLRVLCSFAWLRWILFILDQEARSCCPGLSSYLLNIALDRYHWASILSRFSMGCALILLLLLNIGQYQSLWAAPVQIARQAGVYRWLSA